MKRYVHNISGFSDFIKYHKDGTPFFMVNGRLVYGFDLLCQIKYKYNFLDDCQNDIERAIFENLYFFDVFESSSFYYPNDNMHSHSNEKRGIKGNILQVKRKYREQWK